MQCVSRHDFQLPCCDDTSSKFWICSISRLIHSQFSLILIRFHAVRRLQSIGLPPILPNKKSYPWPDTWISIRLAEASSADSQIYPAHVICGVAVLLVKREIFGKTRALSVSLYFTTLNNSQLSLYMFYG